MFRNANRCALATAAGLVVLSTAPSAWAWGAEGHEAVCEIAYLELTPSAKQKVDAILSHETDSHFRTFRQACGWADHMGSEQAKHRPEHYINVPRHWHSIWYEDCPQADRCLFTAIRRDASIVESPTSTDEERLIALKFLGHWVGDIHQPLHVSFEDDRGGNDIELKNGIGCKRRLHDVWDNCIPEDRMKELGVTGDREAFGKALHDAIAPAQRTAWLADMALVSWANESFALAEVPEVQYCIKVDQRCWYAQNNFEYEPESDEIRTLSLTSAYEDDHGAEVTERLQAAGVRLGAMLNEMLGP